MGEQIEGRKSQKVSTIGFPEGSAFSEESDVPKYIVITHNNPTEDVEKVEKIVVFT